MIEPIIGNRCILCGLKVWREGEALCIRHDIQFLIALGYERMKQRAADQRRRVRITLSKINQPKEIET